MIRITDRSKCSGCTACAGVCPAQCIKMQPDEEGFLYPVVDEEKCVGCGLCEKTCPVLNTVHTSDEKTCFYVVRAKEKMILESSTSGGFITPLADFVFKKDGVVCGAVFDDAFKVVHHVFSKEDSAAALQKMRGSKYVQSDTANIFEQLKAHLDTGRWVCFIGTPCQIYGFQAYLGGVAYNNLITVDLVCHGVPSPMLWEKYVAYQQKRYRSKIKSVQFRHKTYGYRSSTMRIAFENGKVYHGSARVDYMLKSFFAEISSRPSCYQCAFKGISSVSDFTVYDCWRPKKLVDGLQDDNQGFSNVITHTQKACEILSEIQESFDIYAVEPQRAVRCVDRIVVQSAMPHENRASFYQQLNSGDFSSVLNALLHITTKDRLVELAKPVAHRLGVFQKMRAYIRRG